MNHLQEAILLHWDPFRTTCILGFGLHIFHKEYKTFNSHRKQNCNTAMQFLLTCIPISSNTFLLVGFSISLFFYIPLPSLHYQTLPSLLLMTLISFFSIFFYYLFIYISLLFQKPSQWQECLENDNLLFSIMKLTTLRPSAGV